MGRYKLQNQYISSTRVREHIIKGNDTWKRFVPAPCIDRIDEHIKFKKIQ